MKEYATGAMRDNEGKRRYDRIPLIFLDALESNLTRGAKQYGAYNWKLGMPIQETFSSLLRHVHTSVDMSTNGSMIYDRDDKGESLEEHLAAIMTNAGMILYTLEEIQKGNLPSTLMEWDNVVPKDHDNSPLTDDDGGY